MFNENKKKVSIWKARHKAGGHPWTFFYAEDDQSFALALAELNRRLHSQSTILLYKGLIPTDEKRNLKRAISAMRRLVDHNEISAFEFVRVYNAFDDERIEGMAARKASIRISIEEARRWLYEQGYSLIVSHEKDLEKNSTGLLYQIARGAN